MKPLPRRQPGLAPLEFALGVAVAGVVLAFGLAAVAHLKGLGDEARRVTLAAHQSAASTTQMLSCELKPAAQGASVAASAHSCP